MLSFCCIGVGKKSRREELDSFQDTEGRKKERNSLSDLKWPASRIKTSEIWKDELISKETRRETMNELTDLKLWGITRKWKTGLDSEKSRKRIKKHETIREDIKEGAEFWKCTKPNSCEAWTKLRTILYTEIRVEDLRRNKISQDEQSYCRIQVGSHRKNIRFHRIR